MLRLADDTVSTERAALTARLRAEMINEEEEVRRCSVVCVFGSVLTAPCVQLERVSDSLRKYEGAVKQIKHQLRVQQQQHRAAAAEHERVIGRLRDELRSHGIEVPAAS
jgi:hypothetical protein